MSKWREQNPAGETGAADTQAQPTASAAGAVEVKVAFCQKHWSAIRTEVTRIGLGQFIAQSGIDLQRKMFAANNFNLLEGFEPLFSSSMAITSAVVQAVGATGYTNPCPLCTLEAITPKGNDADWISNAVLDEYNTAVELGLIKANLA